MIRALLVFHVLIHFALVGTSLIHRTNCTNRKECILPTRIKINEIPMMIGLSFSGIVTGQTMKFFNKIVRPRFKNPNGCPLQATFFVADSNANEQTEYCLVQELFNNNNEIGVGSNLAYNEVLNDQMFVDTIEVQKNKLTYEAKIHKSLLKGIRFPYLSESKQNIEYLKNLGFDYVSSELSRPSTNSFKSWPHKINSLQTKNCTNCRERSFWQVQLKYFHDWHGRKICPLFLKDNGDSNNKKLSLTCNQMHKPSVEKIVDILLTSFKKSRVNKTPFIFDIKTKWINQYGGLLCEALQQFIGNVTINEDVYFLSVSNIIDWIEYPDNIEISGQKWLWSCDSFSYPYAEDCSRDLHRLEEKEKELSSNLEAKEEKENGEPLYPSKSIFICFTAFLVKGFFYMIIIDHD